MHPAAALHNSARRDGILEDFLKIPEIMKLPTPSKMRPVQQMNLL